MNQAPSASWIDRFAAHPLLISLLLFSLAIALRLLALRRYITPDELIWVYRSVLFREAILAGQWADTLVAGHPGVITTWLGTGSLTLQMLFQPASREVYTWITQLAYLTPDNMAAFQQLSVFLNSGRIAVATVNSAGVVAVFWLVRELLNGRIALIAALLLALDPFLSGLSGLFHVDGLLTTWSVLSLLALALGIGLGHGAQDRNRRLIWLAFSGASAALAALSKSPALLLLPVTALALLSLLWREDSVPLGRRLSLVVGYGAVWIATFLLVLLLLYPALWSSPLSVLSTAGGNAGRHVEEALRPTFFMGDVAYDHGLLFYPVVLLWRLSPLVIGGIILLVVYTVRRPRFREREMKTVLFLAFWVLLFLAGITFAAKKFDRYLLPVIPALAILAAIALARRGAWQSQGTKVLLLLLAAANVIMLVISVPYLLSAYNPLTGGPITAQYVLPLGWGEGISAGGIWLAETPDAESKTVVSGIAPSLAPFFTGTTLFAETTDPQQSDFVILTANSRQADPDSVARADEELEKIHTVRFGLLDQAWVHHNPDARPLIIEPQELLDPVSFGGQIQLLAQDLQTSSNNEEVLFTARWRKEQVDPRLRLRIRLQDEAGQTWSEVETDLLNEVYFYPQDWQAEETPQVTYRLDRPAAMPPGIYTVNLSLIDDVSGEHLAMRLDGHSGGVVYAAGIVPVELPQEMPDLASLQMMPIEGAAWLDGDLRLLGISDYVPLVQTGGNVELELFWQSRDQLPADLQIALQLDGSDLTFFPLSSFDSGEWPPDTVLQQKYSLPVPVELDSADYELSVSITDNAGEPLSDRQVVLGAIQVQAVDRLLELPDDIVVPLEIRYEPGIMLKGLSPEAITAVPGENIDLTLYWQTEAQTAEPVTSFIHLLDLDGEIIAQTDQWPGGLPSNVWSVGQVIVDEHTLALPPDITPGEYRMASGLYTASDGVRLPAFDSTGEHLVGDLYELPVMVSISE